MFRIAAVGDPHITRGAARRLRPVYQRTADVADALLLAGDLTEDGGIDSAAEVCELFGGLDLPVVAVLGNHDYDRGQQNAFVEMLTEAGVTVLEGSSTVVTTAAGQFGIAGVKGFGGGFAGGTVAEHGEQEMKAFARHSAATAWSLWTALARLDVEHRVVLTHYAPTRETLAGEPPELYPFLGSGLLGAAIDGEPAAIAAAGEETRRRPARPFSRRVDDLTGGGPRPAALALHGHAHYGTEVGATPAGTAVRNVAAPVIHAPFAVYRLPGAVRIG